MNALMDISGKQYSEIGDYVQTHLADWMKKVSPVDQVPLQLLERMVRVEEETKYLRESMKEGFKRSDENFQAMEKRFESVQKQMEVRFDSSNKRMDRLMIWTFGLAVTSAGAVIAVLK